MLQFRPATPDLSYRKILESLFEGLQQVIGVKRDGSRQQVRRQGAIVVERQRPDRPLQLDQEVLVVDPRLARLIVVPCCLKGRAIAMDKHNAASLVSVASSCVQWLAYSAETGLYDEMYTVSRLWVVMALAPRPAAALDDAIESDSSVSGPELADFIRDCFSNNPRGSAALQRILSAVSIFAN